MKLSKTQLAILRRTNEGETIPWHARGVRMNTLWALERRGLIRDSKAHWMGGYYVITPAGRAYLEEHDVDR